MRQGHVTIWHLNAGMGLAPHLTHRLDDFRHPSTVAGVVVAKATAVGVEWQAPNPRNEVAVGDEPAPRPFFAEPEILEGLEYSNRERVVD